MVTAIPTRERHFIQENSEKMLIGRLEGKLETVKKLLNSGVEIQSIAKFTDLTCEQIECIRNY